MCAILEELLPSEQNSSLTEKGIEGYRDLMQFVEDRPGHDRRYAIDATKVKRELNWEPQHDLESGLRNTIRWYLDHLDWCGEVQSGGYMRERLGLGGEVKR